MMFDLFSEVPIYNFKHIGGFGQFASGCSFTIEYVLTTFAADELSQLTSVIDNALKRSVAPRPQLIRYLLQLDEVADALTGDESTPLSDSYIQWHQLSMNHKTILEAQVRTHLVPCLERLFFDNKEMIKAFEGFSHQLQALKEVAGSEQPEALEAQLVLKQILDYVPISDSRSFEMARMIYRDFEAAVRQEKAKKVSPLIQYVWFQRALFEAWAQLLESMYREVPNPYSATQGFLPLLDLAFQQPNALLSVEQLYLQKTVFLGTQFIVREETRKILTHLLLAQLANPFVPTQVVEAMELPEPKANLLAVKLQKQGEAALAKVLKAIERALKKQFSTTYQNDFSMNPTQREALIQAEEEFKRQQQEVKKGLRLKNAVSKQFEQLVADGVRDEVAQATEQLKDQILLIKY